MYERYGKSYGLTNISTIQINDTDVYETKFFVHIYVATVENLEFFDTPVYIHVHVVTMHKCKTIMTVHIMSV